MMRRWGMLLAIAACGTNEPAAPALDVTIESGPLHGVVQNGIRKFYGIPYAAPPVGQLRWKSPQPVTPWTDVRDASAPGSVCPQYNPFGASGGDEDCLYLNVFAPSSGDHLPVMFWIHGGAFIFGSGSETYYDGGKLAARGVIVVSINYRLGAFGSFAHPAVGTGNFGLEDQIAAMQWVQRNIAAFGGDPANVTLFGESAGGFSVCAHYLNPATHGLFVRAISESGLCTSSFERTPAQAMADSLVIASTLGCTGSDAAACLGSKTADELTMAISPPPIAMQPPGGPLYLPSFISPAPFVDPKTLPQTMREAFAAGGFEPRPLLLGTNRDEGTLFHSVILAKSVDDDAAYRTALGNRFGTANVDAIVAKYPTGTMPNQTIAQVTGDAFFVCPARRTARAATAAGAPVYRYTFEKEFESALITDGGVVHSAEIPYVFGNDNFLLGHIGQSGIPVSDAVQGYWTRFAKTGDPNGEGAVAWPAYGSDQHLLIDATIAPGSGLKAALCDFWDSL